MNYNYSIGIITFNKRFDLCFKNLLASIKYNRPELEVIICVNGNYNEKFDQNFRKEMLLFLANFDNVYPVFYNEFRGCSKMWNTMLVNSSNDNILFLSDDIVISGNFLDEVNDLCLNRNESLIFNDGFSHWIINRKEIDKLGYFDERLIGYGEEDGDIFYRYTQMFNKPINRTRINGVYDQRIDVMSNFEKGVGKYSKFNRDWIFKNKYIPGSVGGTTDMFSMYNSPHKKILEDVQQYPYEKFYWENKNKQ